MNERRELKAEYKRLKRLAKREPALFARIAETELGLGKVKAARKRLSSGIKEFPEYVTARSLLAECLSLSGEHEASLKEWEEVIYAEPLNQQARAGYIQELAFLERFDTMSEAIADLYLIDPFDEEIAERHHESMLKAIRKRHPNIRAWNPQWHPGDFTRIGAIARAVAYYQELAPRREALPDGFEPPLDEAAMQTLLEKLSGAEVGDDLEASIEEMAAVDTPPDEASEEEDYDLEMPELEDVGEASLETSDEDALQDAEQRALSALLEDEEETTQPAEAGATGEFGEQSDDDVDALLESIESAANKEPEAESPLISALIAADVDPTGIVDIEAVVNRLDSYDTPLVDAPDLTSSVVDEAPVVELDAEEKEVDKEEDSAEAKGSAGEEGGADQPITQADLDGLSLPETAGGETGETDQEETPAPAPTESVKPPKAAITQEDLDKLIAASKAESSDKATSGEKDEGKKESAKAPKSAEAPSGPLSQSDLDALIEANRKGGPSAPDGDAGTNDKETAEPAEDTGAEEKPAAEKKGFLTQDALDALLADSEAVKPPANLANEADTEQPSDSTPSEQEEDAAEAAPDTEGGSATEDRPAEDAPPAADADSPKKPRNVPLSGSSPQPPSGFDIDRWFAKRREQRVKEEQQEQPAAEEPVSQDTPSPEPVAADMDAADADPLRDIVDEEPPAPVAEARVEEPDEAETTETTPSETKTPEPDTAKTPRPAPSAAPHPSPRRHLEEEDEITPEQIRGPMTKTSARLYLMQGKVDHAKVIVDHLLEKAPEDPEVLTLREEIAAKQG